MKKGLDLEGFKKSLPVIFKNADLLEKVFVHKSFLNEKASALLKESESNERLEFLGDAVLSNIISHLLYKKYPGIDEGELTKLRSKLVNRQTLAKLAKAVQLDEYLLLGKGEHSGGGRENQTILAGVFEALIAAIYLETGYMETFGYIETVFSPLLDSVHIEPGHFDSKPMLQELSQRIFRENPAYRLVREDGPPHKKTFLIEVLISGVVLGTGTAMKKKDAEQMAAAEALKKLQESYKALLTEENSGIGA